MMHDDEYCVLFLVLFFIRIAASPSDQNDFMLLLTSFSFLVCLSVS